MPYTIRRITLRSAARLGCALGWLAALFPSLVLAGLAIAVLRQVNQAFQQVEPVTLTVLGQEIARIDFLEILRLSAAAQTVGRWVENAPVTFITLALLLLVAGAIVLAGISLLLVLGYNLLAANGWGLVVELQENNPSS